MKTAAFSSRSSRRASTGQSRTWIDKLRTPPTVTTQARLAMALLIYQAGISVTGSIVRVTGSGLGCPTWPDCQPGSLIPEAGVRPWLHQLIEFGNRSLTFPLVALTIAVMIAVFLARRRSEVLWLAFSQILGVIAQAIIGGISVRMQLRWWSVSLHFLPSMLLVFLCGMLWVKILQPDDGTPQRTYPRPLAWLAALSSTALAFVLATGTMVTGAGRHAGDAVAGESGRLGIDLAYIANIHAHFMYLYLGMTVGLLFGLITSKAPREVMTTTKVLLGVIITQAAVGIIQFNFHVPKWTVPFHVGLSGAVTGVTAILFAYAITRTAGSGYITGSPRGDRLRAASLGA